MSFKLQQLKQMTTIVADTGDIQAISRFKPEDATTNPSLLLKAAGLSQYQKQLTQAQKQSRGDIALACDLFAVAIGQQILEIIPGYISTEVDARTSFDTQQIIQRVQRLCMLYKEAGVNQERVLIKIAATWEGIQAAQQLESQGIKTNLTLMFSFAQAVACAQAGVFLISPYVGRIYDWYKKQGVDFTDEQDPGVQSVARIYRYYKQYGYATIVMGASFRNVNQIEQLAGCDRLTIGPDLLEQLNQTEGTLTRKLTPEQPSEDKKQILNENQFRWALNEDAMTTEKLAEGIRNFAKDQEKLEALLSRNMA